MSGALGREVGMVRSQRVTEREDPGWTEKAVQAIAEFATLHEQFPVESVRVWAEQIAKKCPPAANPKAWGSAIVTARKRGLVVANGAIQVQSSNNSFKTLWRSRIYKA